MTAKKSGPKRSSKSSSSKSESGSARKSTRKSTRRKISSKADRISKIIDQAKEPLGLIDTLKEEGLARAGYLMGVAAGTASSLTKESVKSQVKDVAKTLGLVTKKEYDRLKARLEDLESRFEAMEDHLGLSVVDADEADDAENESLDVEDQEDEGVEFAIDDEDED